MRASGECPKCGGRRIIRLPRVADASDQGGTTAGDMTRRNGCTLVPRQIAERAVTESGLFGNSTLRYVGACPTEAYVCSGCGFVEEYVKDVENIDWTEIHGAVWHGDSDGDGE